MSYFDVDASARNCLPIARSSHRQASVASASATLVNASSNPCPHACVMARPDSASTASQRLEQASPTSSPPPGRTIRCMPPGLRSPRCCLALSHHPVLDPEILAGAGIGPPRDVAGGKHARHAGLDLFVHGHPPVGLQVGVTG